MAITYICCKCNNAFPAEESIDGYKQGYKTGFLCPICGGNIRSSMVNTRFRHTPEQRKWALVTFILALPALAASRSDVMVSISGFEMHLGIALFVPWAVFFVTMLVIKPKVFLNSTILTEPVDES